MDRGTERAGSRLNHMNHSANMICGVVRCEKKLRGGGSSLPHTIDGTAMKRFATNTKRKTKIKSPELTETIPGRIVNYKVPFFLLVQQLPDSVNHALNLSERVHILRRPNRLPIS